MIGSAVGGLGGAGLGYAMAGKDTEARAVLPYLLGGLGTAGGLGLIAGGLGKAGIARLRRRRRRRRF